MNILRICYEYPPPWGGLVPGPYEISRFQTKIGHKILFIHGGSKKEKKIFTKKIETKCIGKSLPTWGFGPFFTFDIKVVSHLFKLLKKEKIDIIHAHGSVVLWFNLLRYFGFFRNVPYIFHAHTSGIRYFLTYWPNASVINKIKALFIWPLLTIQDFLSIKVANAIIIVSEKERSIFLKYYKCPPAKLFLVENGVNTELFSPKKQTGRDNIIKLLHVGVIRELKNIEKSIYVLTSLKNMGVGAQLSLVGNGNPWYIKSLKSLSRKLLVEDKIKWIGYIPYPQLAETYHKNDILLLLSHSEGLPKVVLEALSCGLKVVSSKSFYSSDILMKNIFWVDNNDSPQEIANKIIQISQKNTSTEFLRKFFSWLRTVKNIDEIYRIILSSR